MRFKVYPYKQGSRSAKMLAVALGGKVLKRINSKFVPKAGDVVINWGSSNVPDFGPATVLNRYVDVAQCKLSTFKALSAAGVHIPQFTESKEVVQVANHWPIVCRTNLKGHSGDGIVIANNASELVDAPLYTKYIKKKDEYRVHIIRSPDPDPDVTQFKAFFIQRKAKKSGVTNPNWKVRNLAGGFSFKEVNYNDVPTCVIAEAYKAMYALNLDFGGVDVIYNEKTDAAYVLEINTACGLEERTADKYAGVFYVEGTRNQAYASACYGPSEDFSG